MKKTTKLLIVVGARPNFIKVAPLMEEIRKHKDYSAILVHTGQHYDFEMSQVFFQDLNIPKPDFNLSVGSGSHAVQTAEVMIRIEPVLLREKPDAVILIGDVNSTVAVALVAAKLKIPIAHIESGLRSYDKTIPEEVNRVLSDHLSLVLFCPTVTAVENLKKEGITKDVYNVGDIMYDAFLKNIEVAQKKSRILSQLKLPAKKYILSTVHRPANSDNLENLTKILKALEESRERIIFPIHPRTENQVKKTKIKNLSNIQFIKPVSYLDMIVLEKNASKILTDSGGVQKEAYFAKTPCITLRDKTEWVETVNDGWNILVGVNEEKIMKAIKSFNPSGKQKKNYGNGKSAEKIIRVLKRKAAYSGNIK